MGRVSGSFRIGLAPSICLAESVGGGAYVVRKLTEQDHRLLDNCIGKILDGYKIGHIQRYDAIDRIAQIVAYVDKGGDFQAYLKALLDPEAD